MKFLCGYKHIHSNVIFSTHKKKVIQLQNIHLEHHSNDSRTQLQWWRGWGFLDYQIILWLPSTPNSYNLNANIKSRLSPVLLLMGYRLEVPRTPSLHSINFLEQFTEIKIPIYSLDYWFIIKWYKSLAARWNTCIRQGMEKCTELLYPLRELHTC